jgi:hypothetical protein
MLTPRLLSFTQRESSLKYMTRSLACMPTGEGYATASVEGRIAVEWFDVRDEVGLFLLCLFAWSSVSASLWVAVSFGVRFALGCYELWSVLQGVPRFGCT